MEMTCKTLLIDFFLFLCIPNAFSQWPLLDVEKITTKDYRDPAPSTTNDEEFICTNAFQVDERNSEQMLVGICRNNVGDATSSSAIGHIPIADMLDPATVIPSLNELYGNTSSTGPENGANWDGEGRNALLSFPEEFIQVDNSTLYFVDVRSCLRKVDRNSSQVSTLLGSCGNSTLNLPGVAALRVYGMAYFEEDNTFVFTIAQEGVYVCVENPPGEFTCRRVIERADFNSDIPTDTGRQLIRGMNSNGNQNDYIWHKVRFGINRYDFSTVIGNDTVTLKYDNNTLLHYASIRVTDEIETTAWYKDNSTEIGTNDAVLLFSKDGKVLLIFDIFNDVVFALDTYPDDEIDSVNQLCQRTTGTREDFVANCTFSDIRAAVWLEDQNKIVISERGPGQIRIVEVNPLPTSTPTTTTSTTTTTTTTTTSTTTTTITTTSTTTTTNDASTDGETGTTALNSSPTISFSRSSPSATHSIVGETATELSTTTTKRFSPGYIALIVISCLLIIGVIVVLVLYKIGWLHTCEYRKAHETVRPEISNDKTDCPNENVTTDAELPPVHENAHLVKKRGKAPIENDHKMLELKKSKKPKPLRESSQPPVLPPIKSSKPARPLH